MPYSSNKALPDVVHRLPDRAQDIWRTAFNKAHAQHGGEKDAFRIAWAAVERAGYGDDHRDGGHKGR